MKVAIAGGTAGLGFGLAARIAHGGDEVVIGSRQADKASSAAGELNERLNPAVPITGTENSAAVAGAELVIVTVPFPAMAAVYTSLKEALPSEASVVDATVPLASEIGGKATRMLGIWEGSAAQFAKTLLNKDVHLAAAFHTVMGQSLLNVDDPVGSDVLACGDARAKELLEQVVSKMEGTRLIDCGPLEKARILESMTALLIGLNARHHLKPGAGVRITGIEEQS